MEGWGFTTRGAAQPWDGLVFVPARKDDNFQAKNLAENIFYVAQGKLEAQGTW